MVFSGLALVLEDLRRDRQEPTPAPRQDQLARVSSSFQERRQSVPPQVGQRQQGAGPSKNLSD